MSKFIEVTDYLNNRCVIKVDSIIEIRPNSTESTYIKLIDGSSVSSNFHYHEIVKVITGLDVEPYELRAGVELQ